MTRQIKFRVWNKPTKIMGYFKIFDSFWRSLSADERNTLPEYNEIMQYTGLKDKNGKEIFEGDILKNTKYNDQLVEVYWKGCVKDSEEINGEDWINWGGWHFKKVDKTSTELTYAIYNSEIEIIGNVWENPELNRGDEELRF